MKLNTVLKGSETRVARLFLVQHTKRGKIYQMTTNIPNGHKLPIPIGRKISKRLQNIPTSSVARPSKIYQNWDFGFENIPSGNPDRNLKPEIITRY
jgi:hypothetical protein